MRPPLRDRTHVASDNEAERWVSLAPPVPMLQPLFPLKTLNPSGCAKYMAQSVFAGDTMHVQLLTRQRTSYSANVCISAMRGQGAICLIVKGAQAGVCLHD